MATNMKENGRITREMDLAYTFGKFKTFMKDNGRMTRCMDRESIIKMGKHMRVNTKITKKKEKECFTGTMETGTQVCFRRM